jgi:hypothetical protein
MYLLNLHQLENDCYFKNEYKINFSCIVCFNTSRLRKFRTRQTRS